MRRENVGLSRTLLVHTIDERRLHDKLLLWGIVSVTRDQAH